MNQLPLEIENIILDYKKQFEAAEFIADQWLTKYKLQIAEANHHLRRIGKDGDCWYFGHYMDEKALRNYIKYRRNRIKQLEYLWEK